MRDTQSFSLIFISRRNSANSTERCEFIPNANRSRTISQMRSKRWSRGREEGKLYGSVPGLSRIPAFPLRVITRSYLHTCVSIIARRDLYFAFERTQHALQLIYESVDVLASRVDGQRPEKYQFLNRDVIVTRATRLLPTACAVRKKNRGYNKEAKAPCERKTRENVKWPRISQSRFSIGLSYGHC